MNLKTIAATLMCVLLLILAGLALPLLSRGPAAAQGSTVPMVAAGYGHTVGLRADGTVVAVGYNNYGQCNVGGWTDITQVSAGYLHTVGLKLDGTVVAVGWNYYGQCNVAGWTGVTQVAAGWHHTVGLKSDGTVVAVGDNGYGQLNVAGWTDITQVAGGWYHTVGVRADGTVVAAGYNRYGQCNVAGWTGISQVAAGGYHTVALKLDGTVVAAGDNYYGQCNVAGWTDITQVAAGGYHTVGLRADGTVVAVGYNNYGQCNVGGWTDITQLAAGRLHTVGLRADGTVVAVGDTGYGRCNVGGWNLAEVVDSDGDGLTDAEEAAGWDITIYNCDGSVSETYHVTSDPYQVDEDGDGLNDKEEKDGWHVKYRYQVSPPPHPVWTWVEYDVKSNPHDADIDIDGKNDKQEKAAKTDPNRANTDCDGHYATTDGFEIDYGLNPLDFDTDNDGFADGLEIDLWLEAGYSLNEAVANTSDPAAIPPPTPTPTPTPPPPSGGGGGGGGGFCFIATAAYGSYLDSHVETLRSFRDSYMVTNPVGSALVSTYYKLSPPVAEFIDDHPALKPVVRVGLLPAVGLSTVAVSTTSAEKLAIVGSLALVSLALAVWLRKQRGKGSEYS